MRGNISWKNNSATGVAEKELIRIAILSMGLDELGPFKPEERIIEYKLREPSAGALVKMTLRDFADETASESPAPGGGSIAAYAGRWERIGTMVANLSAHKKGWDDRWKGIQRLGGKGAAA
jgi:glutamate formiminotransferase/formiminotetrahydrofolate cyclodeaminase